MPNQHKKYRRGSSVLVSTVLALTFGITAFNKLKTNIEVLPNEFVVSNYDIGKGYTFIYKAYPCGSEHLAYMKDGCTITVNTDYNDPNKTGMYIRLGNYGRYNYLSNTVISPESFSKSFYRPTTREKMSEDLLSDVRGKYKDHIPFKKVLDKLSPER